MLVRILNTLRSRIWDMVVFLFSDYSKSTVGENGDCPEVYGFYWLEWTSPERYGFPENQIPRNWHLYKEFYFFCRHLLLLIVIWLKVRIFWRIPFSFQHKLLISIWSQKAENQKFNIEENVMSERVKMPSRHFLRSDYLHIFFYIKFLVFVSLVHQIRISNLSWQIYGYEL